MMGMPSEVSRPSTVKIWQFEHRPPLEHQHRWKGLGCFRPVFSDDQPREAHRLTPAAAIGISRVALAPPINAASENFSPSQRNNMRDKENAIAADQTAQMSHVKSNV
jgi:hypothetical protein